MCYLYDITMSENVIFIDYYMACNMKNAISSPIYHILQRVFLNIYES
jgi:hypothetical protein